MAAPGKLGAARPGAEMSWDAWTKLPAGAWISTSHRLAGREVVAITDRAAATTLAELEPGADPFAQLKVSAPE